MTATQMLPSAVPGTAAPRSKRRVRKVAFAVATFLVVLELVLQIGALVVALTVAPPATGGVVGEVLCIGDSYTFGIGALTPEGSYPSRLQAELKARGLHTRVVNAGVPGRNSQEALLCLSTHLKPGVKVACVLLGANDSWSRPQRLDTDKLAMIAHEYESMRFRLRWRTGRLLAIAFRFAWGSWRDTSSNAATPAAVDAGEAERNRIAGYMLIAKLVAPTGSLPEPAYGPATSPETEVRVAAVWEALRSQRLARAYELAVEAVNADPTSAVALCVLAISARKLGHQAEADTASGRIEGMLQANPVAADALLPVLWEAGRTQDLLAVARRRIAQEPRSVAAWTHLELAAFTMGLHDEFRHAAIESLRLLGMRSPGQSASVAIRLARLEGKSDPIRGAMWIVASMLLGGPPGWARLELMLARPELTGEHVEQALADAGNPEGNVVAALRELTSGKDDANLGNVLRDNLTTIGRLASDVGARVVLISYPFFAPEVEAAQAAAAAVLGEPHVLVRERFDQELKTRPREDLFVADGHCNDAGYSIVAAMVADHVAAALRR